MGNKNIILWFTLIISVHYWSCNRNVIAKGNFPKSEMQYYTGSSSIVGVTDTSDENKVHSDPIVLCYHQIRDCDGNDSKAARPYIVPVSKFRTQMKFLYENGYHTILPNQLVNFYQQGEKLPDKPLLLTFDDGTISQYLNALPELEQYGFKATFFIMTVTIGRSGYMAGKDIRYLADNGHIIGCHTWDHHNVTQYKNNDWKIQLKKPTELLQKITGNPIEYFAYPYGAWNLSAIEYLKEGGYHAAFQLSGKKDKPASLYTIRRMIVDGNWSMKQFETEFR
ncbi:MAG: polysaccharide deacetylase family protein [Taibaiella sp.]|jgi:peptidoglycan/xylan/chitin deacetylase (PgdA/CDA1 family)